MHDPDLATLSASFIARINALDRIKADLVKALRKADADMAALMVQEPAPTQRRTWKRDGNGSTVLPTRDASADSS